MPSPAEIAAGDTPGVSPPELGPLSPELALVDPELGRAARQQLPDRPRAAPVHSPSTIASVAEQPALVERPRTRLEPIPEPAPPRRRVRLRVLVSAAGVLALGVLLTLVVDRENRPAENAQQTQSVAAAVSPTAATPTQPARSATTTATPAKPAGTSTTPATSTPVHEAAVPGQTFVWVAAPEASAYEFQLFQAGERIFRTRVDKPRLEVPGRWRLAGRPHALLPGSYRWYVWSISKRTKRQSTTPTVSAKLVIEDQPQ